MLNWFRNKLCKADRAGPESLPEVLPQAPVRPTTTTVAEPVQQHRSSPIPIPTPSLATAWSQANNRAQPGRANRNGNAQQNMHLVRVAEQRRATDYIAERAEQQRKAAEQKEEDARMYVEHNRDTEVQRGFCVPVDDESESEAHGRTEKDEVEPTDACMERWHARINHGDLFILPGTYADDEGSYF